MHGSRRRLHERLARVVPGRFDCRTFDRFAWDVVSRWRTRNEFERTPPPPGTSIYDATCLDAARLLASDDIASWVTRRFPVIVVDEFQDCSPERLAIVQALAPHARLLVAADEFQDLRSTATNDAVTWLTAQDGVHELTHVHRTNRAGLLDAALTLRNGTALRSGVGFTLTSVPSSPLAASKITFLIAGTPKIELAVLSPARPGNAAFVDQIVENVSTKSYGKSKTGPFSLRWEETSDGAYFTEGDHRNRSIVITENGARRSVACSLTVSLVATRFPPPRSCAGTDPLARAGGCYGAGGRRWHRRGSARRCTRATSSAALGS